MSALRYLACALTLALAAPLLAAGEVPDAVQKRFPAATEIVETPIPGLYSVREGFTIRHVDATGTFAFMIGDITDLDTGVNLTEEQRKSQRRQLMADIDQWDPIDFTTENTRHALVVFTDISCGYCQQLHRNRAEYDALGIGFRYLAFPRAGVDSDAGKALLAVWCADDRQDAMNRAKAGEILPAKICPAPIASHAELGRALGLRGTPMLVTETGAIIPGAVPPAEMLAILEPSPGA